MSVRKSHPHTGATPLKEGFACLMYGCWGARWQSLSQQQCGKTSLHHHSTRAVLAKRCHFCPVDSAKRTGIPYAVMLISMGIIKRTGSLICPRKMASLTPKISKWGSYQKGSDRNRGLLLGAKAWAVVFNRIVYYSSYLYCSTAPGLLLSSDVPEYPPYWFCQCPGASREAACLPFLTCEWREGPVGQHCGASV